MTTFAVPPLTFCAVIAYDTEPMRWRGFSVSASTRCRPATWIFGLVVSQSKVLILV